MQAANMRAAGNHIIQSTGAQITKEVEVNIWTVQPHGVHGWRVVPMNIHDEVMCPTKNEYTKQVKEIVNRSVESYKPQVPSIAMDWQIGLKSWGEK